ncbi:MAG: hypothetical protein R2710_12820 [Acidimicrobiales bacterium]
MPSPSSAVRNGISTSPNGSRRSVSRPSSSPTERSSGGEDRTILAFDGDLQSEEPEEAADASASAPGAGAVRPHRVATAVVFSGSVITSVAPTSTAWRERTPTCGVDATLTSRPAFDRTVDRGGRSVGRRCRSTIVLVDHDRLDPLRHVVLAATGEGPSVRFGETKGDQVLALLKPLEDDLIDS